MTKENATGTVSRELLISRIFNAPVDTVFDAWTDPEQVEQWWGPKTFSSSIYEWEARPGGCIHMDMIGPGRTVYPVHGSFHEVNEPERLLFTSMSVEDEDGESQLEVLNTIIFLDYKKKTRLTLQAVVIRSTPETAPSVDNMEQGWRQSLDKLAGLLNKMSS